MVFSFQFFGTLCPLNTSPTVGSSKGMFLTKLNFVPIDIIQSICFTVFAICYVNADYLLFVDCV